MADEGMQMQESSTGFARLWARFLAHFKSHEEILLRELSNSWNDVSALLDAPVAENVRQALVNENRPIGLEEYLRLRTTLADALLHGPLAQLQRSRPARRATAALESYERTLHERLAHAPEELALDGTEALSGVGEEPVGPLSAYVARLRRKPKAVPLRAVLGRELQAFYPARAEEEGRYFSALFEATRHVRSPWQDACAALDDRVAGGGVQDLGRLASRTQDRTEAIRAKAAEALAARTRWTDLASQRMARRLVAAVAWRGARVGAARHNAAVANLQHWTAMSRALDSEGGVGILLERCEREILALGLRSLAGLHHELELLTKEISSAIDWLERQVEAASVGEFPSPAADIIPASSRLNELEEGMKSALNALPEVCPVPGGISRRSGNGLRLKTLRPRQTFYECYVRVGRETVSALLERVKNDHRNLVQAIERAREVVRFARETAGSNEVSTPVLKEGLENALSLLKYHREEAPRWASTGDAELARCLAEVFVENRLMLSRRILGGAAHLARHGARRAFASSSAGATKRLKVGLQQLETTSEKGMQRFLVGIGWSPAPLSGRVDVITRPFLPREFTVDLSSKELPALYRHLFRFEPVKDPRFLVGREREMAAIEQARAFWESSRPVALIIVGERGSGKTSLINCAVKHCLAGIELVRGEFSERVVTPPALRRFLSGLVGAPDPAQLEGELNRQKRVLIIEELERCFLRQVGHYDAVRELQRLIAATCTSTLWILAINELAFQFLNATVDLGSTFSHRINAGTARPADLRQAIMLRHELSGLRLQFPPPAPRQRGATRLPLKLNKPRDPETEFFDLLARESGGVYRSAFDIWLGQIEGAQAGILYMKSLEAPDLGPLMADLNQEDVFTLLTIPQHGGLTAEEHAVIFQKPIAASRGIIDGLLAREIIEPDPGRPGFRVRPEATRIVRETLYRKNLI